MLTCPSPKGEGHFVVRFSLSVINMASPAQGSRERGLTCKFAKKFYNGFIEKDRPMHKTIHPGLFIAGLVIVISAAGLLVPGVIESGPAAALGMLGIGLIAASGRSHIKRLH